MFRDIDRPTPGPWYPSIDAAGNTVLVDGNGETIAICIGPNAKANARVVSAFPNIRGAFRAVNDALREYGPPSDSISRAQWDRVEFAMQTAMDKIEPWILEKRPVIGLRASPAASQPSSAGKTSDIARRCARFAARFYRKRLLQTDSDSPILGPRRGIGGL